MGQINIIAPGFFTTIQDGGRPGLSGFGISPSGAADSVSLRVGNLLVANQPNAAALEMTLTGGTFNFESDATIALTGATMRAEMSGDVLRFWRSYRVQAGQTLIMGAAKSGCRSYLCVSGGIKVPPVLGSASTHIYSRLGGLEGRALQNGDVIEFSSAPSPVLVKLRDDVLAQIQPRKKLRFTKAIHSHSFAPQWAQALASGEYRVTEKSNRLGITLSGAPFRNPPEVLTTGVCLGTIQITPDGQPTILFVDQQITGGYPQIACVIAADHSSLGQLRPAEIVRFEKIDFEEAKRLFCEQERLLQCDLFLEADRDDPALTF